MRFSYVMFAAAALLAAAPAAQADTTYEAGTVLVRARVLDAMPDMGSKVNLGAAYHVTSSDFMLPEVDFTYFLDPHWSLELIAGTTKHSLYLNKSVYLGSAWLLPPTLTVQYHFDQIGPFKPYIGAGINYSLFYDKRGAAALGKLKMTDQWGGAIQVGADIPVTEDGRYFINIDAKKIFVSTHASFAASPATANVDVNPWVFGAGVGIKL